MFKHKSTSVSYCVDTLILPKGALFVYFF